jgi:hypothetical protein
MNASDFIDVDMTLKTPAHSFLKMKLSQTCVPIADSDSEHEEYVEQSTSEEAAYVGIVNFKEFHFENSIRLLIRGKRFYLETI